MITLDDYGDYKTAWCPGCGNFGILKSLKQALVNCNLAPHEILLVSGIGQAAKTPHYLNANVFNGLHGRSLPTATGARLVNPQLKVIVTTGDGCMYGEGGNHFLATLRRNIDITVLVHNNQVYGLTKGQASPTSDRGFVTKAQPHGVSAAPFNPVAAAVTMGASFVARGYTGKQQHLITVITEAIQHKGLSLVDILQPCVVFNKVNTYKWYMERCYELTDKHNPTDKQQALAKADEFDAQIPIGIIYRQERPAAFEDQFAALANGPLYAQDTDKSVLAKIMRTYI